MARTSELRIGSFTDDDGIARIGLMRVLLADDTHPEETRTKGGIWVPRTDRDALVSALNATLAYAQALDDALKALDAAPKASKPAPAPKAPKAPASKPAPAPAPEAVTANRAIAEAAAPRAMCDGQSHADNAQAGAKFCPLCGKDLTALARAATVAKARANKPAPAPRVSAPAPEKAATFDWAALVGQ